MSLQIVELFNTIQGEGELAGSPSTFIRFMKCGMNCSFCFHKNTTITMYNYRRMKIKDIRIGMKVIAWDEKTKTYEPKKVIKKYVRKVKSIRKLVFSNKMKLFVTDEHPIYNVDKGWVKAVDLEVGSKVLTYRSYQIPKDHNYGGQHTLTLISNELIDRNNEPSFKHLTGSMKEDIEVYNIEVEDFNTYIAHSVVVHNCDTKFTWNEKYAIPEGSRLVNLNTIEEVDNFIENEPLLKPTRRKKNIVITGGEPLLDSNMPLMIDFIKNLLRRDYRVTIETTMLSNPEKDIKEKDVFHKLIDIYRSLHEKEIDFSNLCFSISPKFPLSCYPMKDITYEDVYKFYSISDEYYNMIKKNIHFYYKFVYFDGYKEYIENIIDRCSSQLEIYVMALTPNTWEQKNQEMYQKNYLDAANFALKKGINLSPRIHIDLWGLKHGV